MIDITSAIITAVSLLAIFGIGYWLWMRRSSANGDREQRERTQEDLRLESSDVKRHERVGFIGRARAQPTTTQLFFGCILAFLMVVAVGVYQVAKTGSPQEMAYADQIEYAISALIFIGTGVWFKNRMDGKAGELAITYEGDQSNVTETLYYDRGLVQPLFDDDGDRDALLLPVFKTHRILGLFWLPKLTADEAAVRDVDKNLPEDQVTYEVPLDQSTTWNQDEGRITVRAKDTDPVKNPKRRATYEFVPSDRKSEAEIQDIQDENEQLRKQLDHERRINAVQTEQLESYEEALENRDHGSLDHLNESLEVFLQVMEATNPQGARRTERGLDALDGNGRGDPRSQAQNGAGTE